MIPKPPARPTAAAGLYGNRAAFSARDPDEVLKRRERRKQLGTLLEQVVHGHPGSLPIMGDLNEWNPFCRSLRRLETDCLSRRSSPSPSRPVSRCWPWTPSWAPPGYGHRPAPGEKPRHPPGLGPPAVDRHPAFFPGIIIFQPTLNVGAVGEPPPPPQSLLFGSTVSNDLRETGNFDLNMVRAGVVTHPREWPYCGYSEIQTPRERYGLIDHDRVKGLTGAKSQQDFRELHRSWIAEGLAKRDPFRDDRWTESLAVGGEPFVKGIRETVWARAIGHSIIEDGEQQQLRDLQQPYSAHLCWTGIKHFSLDLREFIWSDPHFNHLLLLRPGKQIPCFFPQRP
jgi:hypothetical protein